MIFDLTQKATHSLNISDIPISSKRLDTFPQDLGHVATLAVEAAAFQ